MEYNIKYLNILLIIYNFFLNNLVMTTCDVRYKLH